MIIEIIIIQVINKGYKYTEIWLASSYLSESKMLEENYHWFKLQSKMSLTLQFYIHWQY